MKFSDTRENLKEFERLLGVSLSDAAEGEDGQSDLPVSGADQQIAEVVVTTGSPLHQRTLNTSQFRARYRLLPLAIHRARSAPGEITVDFEDALLLPPLSPQFVYVKQDLFVRQFEL